MVIAGYRQGDTYQSLRASTYSSLSLTLVGVGAGWIDMLSVAAIVVSDT